MQETINSIPNLAVNRANDRYPEIIPILSFTTKIGATSRVIEFRRPDILGFHQPFQPEKNLPKCLVKHNGTEYSVPLVFARKAQPSDQIASFPFGDGDFIFWRPSNLDILAL